MNFFDDDFGLGLGSTPVYTKKPSYTYGQKGNINADQLSRKSAKKDEFDDLLDDLMGKQEKKSVKKKERESMQPYSSTNLEPPTHSMDFKKTEKWSTPNIEIDQLMQSPKFPLGKHTSIMDDRISEDARSYKSGFTGRQNNIEFDNLITLRGQTKEDPPAAERSARNMMKPPLRKKQSKENLKEQKQTSFWDDQPQVSFSRRTPPPEQPKQTNLDLLSSKEVWGKSRGDLFVGDLQAKNNNMHTDEKIKERIIQKQKIITVREEATQLKKQFQNEVKEIKQSYERQLNLAQERLKNESEEQKKAKTSLIKQYEEKLKQERSRWEKLLSENTDRLKEVHQWQMTKKCEAYQLEIEKLKSLSKFEDSIIKNQTNFHATQDNLQIKAKERQLQSQKQRLDELKFHLQQRQKHMEFEESQFNNYKRKQEEKIQTERRALYQKQNELKRFELQTKRNLALQKQQISSELAEAELQLFRKKEALNLERQELISLRDMLDKQKSSFEAFNKNILNDYKIKMKEVEAQKQHLHQMQIQVHKNIHTLEMAEGTMRATTTNGKSFQRPSTANAENHRNRSNTVLQSKLNETKGRFKEMQNFARKINIQTHEQRQKIKEKVNLSGYITRVNRALSKY